MKRNRFAGPLDRRLYPEPMSDTPSVPGSRGPYAGTAQRKAEIVRAASRAFAQTGYHGGSLRQIARDLGLSYTSVKHHFPAKEGLLIAVLENADAEEASLVAIESRHDPIEGIVALARRNLRKPEALRLLAVLSAEASSPTHPAHGWFSARYRRVRADFEARFAAAASDGRYPSGMDAAAAARAIIALWDGLQLQWLIEPDFDMVLHLERGIRAVVQSAATEHLPS